MYEYLNGQLTIRKPGYICVEAGGVGYRVEVSLTTYENLPKSGPVKIFTWLKVSDDAMKIYGFGTERERDLFMRLVEGVSQLGPAKALAILSNATADDLVRAIEEGDAGFFRRIKGIGEKLANRIVMELRGKLPAGKDDSGTSISKDAVAALLGLGYDRNESEEAVRKALRGAPDAPLEDVIKRSLANV